MKKITYEMLENSICKYLFDADLQETFNRLNKSLNFVREAKFDELNNFTLCDVENFILTDNNALFTGEIEKGTALYKDVMIIQLAMIKYFNQ